MPDPSGQAPADALSKVLSPEADKTTDAKAELPASLGSPHSLSGLQADPVPYVLNPHKTLHHPPVINTAPFIKHPDPVSIPVGTASHPSDMPVGNSLTPLLTHSPNVPPQPIPRSTLTPVNIPVINPSATVSPMPTPMISSAAAPHPSMLFISPQSTSPSSCDAASSTDDDLVDPVAAADSLAAVDRAAAETCPAAQQPLLAVLPLPTGPLQTVNTATAMPGVVPTLQQPTAEPLDALDNCDATADGHMLVTALVVSHSLLLVSNSGSTQGCLLGPQPLLAGLHQPVCPLDFSDTANSAATPQQAAIVDPSAAQLNSVSVSEHQQLLVAFQPASEPALQPSSVLRSVKASALAPFVSIASRSNSLTAFAQMPAFADSTQLSTALVLYTASVAQTSSVASGLERGSHQLSPALMPHALSAGSGGATHISSLVVAGPTDDKAPQVTALFMLIQCRSSNWALAQGATVRHGTQSPTALAVYTDFAGASWYSSGSIVLSAMCPLMEPASNSKLADCCGGWQDASLSAEQALQGCSSMLLTGTPTSLMGPPLEAGRFSQGRLASALAALVQVGMCRAAGNAKTSNTCAGKACRSFSHAFVQYHCI